MATLYSKQVRVVEEPKQGVSVKFYTPYVSGWIDEDEAEEFFRDLPERSPIGGKYNFEEKYIAIQSQMRDKYNKSIPFEEKVKAVDIYLNTERSLRSVGLEFGVSGTAVRLWVDKYRQSRDVDSLKEARKKYPMEIKVRACMDYINEKGTLKKISDEYGISSPNLLAKWVKRYKKGGVRALENQCCKNKSGYVGDEISV